MIKILHVVSSLNMGGGVQQLLYNYYKNMNSDKVQFDFIVHSEEIGYFEKKFKKFGSNIFHVTPKKQSIIKNFLEIKRIIQKGNYDVVHCHQDFSNAVPLFLAKTNSVPIRISHAHSNFRKQRFVKGLLNKFLRFINQYYGNYYFACSKEAGKWLHGRKWSGKRKKDFIMLNAINTHQFKFNPDIRTNYRDELGFTDEKVVLHVGRFSKEKNHKFLLKLFNQLYNINDNYKLLLVGSGPLKREIKELSNNLDSHKNIIFLGARSDIAEIMQASDIFLLPSTYEGFGMTAIEAQYSGLLTIVSDKVPRSTQISNLIKYLSLKNIDYWIEEILAFDYNDRNFNLIKNKYDAQHEACKYENWLMKKIYSTESR